jgi:hypothetical protein
MAKYCRPNASSTWLIFVCPPYSRFPAELAAILPLPFSLFALVAALSHCLCSESPYLSIKLYCICLLHKYHVKYSVQYYPRFHVTAVGLGTYYPWIRAVAYQRGGFGEGGSTPTKILSFDTAEPNSQFREIYFCNNLIWIRVSFICKLSGTPD